MGDREITYSAARGLLVAALAGHLEGNIVGGVALDLKGTSREVVEVLVDQLDIPCVVSNCDNLRLEGVEGVGNAARANAEGPIPRRFLGALTSLADLAMSENAGIDMVADGGSGGGGWRRWDGMQSGMRRRNVDNLFVWQKCWGSAASGSGPRCDEKFLEQR